MDTKTTFGTTLLCACFILSSCGGGGGGGPGGGRDNSPPSGYSVSFTTDPINESNESAVAFTITGAEVGADYEYTLSAGASEIDGNGSVTQASFDVTGLDLSGFPSGAIELSLTLTDSFGNRGSIVSDSAQKTSEPQLAVLSGTITFDFVPHEPVPPGGGSFGLDYDNTEQRPVRGATLEILDDTDALLLVTETNENGEYSVSLAPGQDVRVRVRAELIADGNASWDFKVTDNTNGDALYVMDGSLTLLSGASQTRDLHAPSGWGFPGYTSERTAAPFAILDTVYQIVDKFVEVDPNIQFPATEFRWSENNVPEDGDGSVEENLAAGLISTSSYRSNGVTGNVYILGAEDEDTDEYDPHVIVHEWGHYFEDRLSRSDSIGGPHSFDESLDMRVAFGEGWGNALSGIILDDSLYLDTGGVGQSQTGGIDLELNNGLAFPGFNPDLGWFSEFSVQSILFDLYDSDMDGDDAISLGLAPFYEALTAPEYVEQGTLTSIYSFLAQLLADNPSESAGINALATAHDIFGTGFDGSGETNDGGIADTLPVYRSVTINGPAVEVCTDNSLGEFNNHGNHSFVQVTLPSTGTYSFTANRTSGLAGADPEIRLVGPFPPLGDRITRFSCGDSETTTLETMVCGGLLAGEHVLDVFDAGNVDDLETDVTGGEVCFDVSVTN